MKLKPHSGKIIIAPSILSADFARLGEEVRALCDAGADCLHLDVMDGHFVPNLTIGPNVVESVRRHSSVPLDVHLMVTNPEQYVQRFAHAGADIITVHTECKTAPNALDKIGALGLGSGIALSPKTRADAIDQFIVDIDLVLVMTVEPGFAAQSFMHDQLAKIKHVRAQADKLNKLDLLLAVDGGINDKTAKLCVGAGANMLVAGSYILKSNSYRETVTDLRGTA